MTFVLTKKPRHRDSKTKKTRHRETETNKPRHRDSKAFFQRTKSHDIEIPRPKSHDIEFLWNSDPYAPWYLILWLDYMARLFSRAEGEAPVSKTGMKMSTNMVDLTGRVRDLWWLVCSKAAYFVKISRCIASWLDSYLSTLYQAVWEKGFHWIQW